MLETLQSTIEYHFEDPTLLQQALRHGSAATTEAERRSYERLELLGDAVLSYAVARMLMERFPRADEGALTRMRAHLTRSASLAQRALDIELDRYVEVGWSEEVSGGRQRQRLLEDLFEALVGAIERDGDWPAASAFVERRLRAAVEELDEDVLRQADPKSALQEVAQAKGLPLPVYREVAHTGPDHRLSWAFEVVWNGEVLARGEGVSKRSAQKEAARRALARLGEL
jgi:ribonuclease-3